MRRLVIVLTMAGLAGVASAQAPGTYPQPYPQQTYPQPPQYPQYPQYGYAQQPRNVQLTVDEQWMLEHGFISDGQTVGGAIAGFMFGFGIGQAIQGRWS